MIDPLLHVTGWYVLAGAILAVLATVLSMRRRRGLRSEGATARGEGHVRSSLDSLTEGCQIVDRHWRYVYLNPAAAHHGGRTVDELEGRTMVDEYPGIERTPMFDALRRAMETREPAEMENEFAGADGESKWFQLVVKPVPEGVVILPTDI